MHTPLFIILIYGESYKWIGEGVEKRGVGLSKMGWRGFPRPVAKHPAVFEPGGFGGVPQFNK